MSDLRKDPTRGRWVLVRPGTKRPAASVCPFCPGNESHTPHEIFAYRKEGFAPNGPGWSVRVIPEADPYFRIEQELVREGLGLYDRISVAQSGAIFRQSYGSRTESRAYIGLAARFGRIVVSGVEGIELDPEPYEVWFVHDKGFLQLQAVF